MLKLSTLFALLAVLTSCATLPVKPTVYTDFECPFSFREIAQADQFIHAVQFVPSYKLVTQTGSTQIYTHPSQLPDVDAEFPLAIISLREDLTGPSLFDTLQHEKCHVWEILGPYLQDGDIAGVVKRNEISRLHTLWTPNKQIAKNNHRAGR